MTFSVVNENSSVRAYWRTASEKDNDYFTLERSVDAKEWQVVTTLPGAGNSSRVLSYTIKDTSPLKGVSYYRLKQTDFDGTCSWSEVRTITVKSTPSSLVIYPNPSDGLNLSFKLEGSSKLQVENVMIYNQNQTLVMNHVPRSDAMANETSTYLLKQERRLPAGQYIVKIKYNNKEKYLKLLVNR